MLEDVPARQPPRISSTTRGPETSGDLGRNIITGGGVICHPDVNYNSTYSMRGLMRVVVTCKYA